MAAMPVLWSTQHWDGRMDSLLTICKHSDDYSDDSEDYGVISVNNSKNQGINDCM